MISLANDVIVQDLIFKYDFLNELDYLTIIFTSLEILTAFIVKKKLAGPF